MSALNLRRDVHPSSTDDPLIALLDSPQGYRPLDGLERFIITTLANDVSKCARMGSRT